MELAAIERLKIDVATFSRVLLISSIYNLKVHVTRAWILISRTSSNFGQIGAPTTESYAVEHLKKTSYRLIMGKIVYPPFHDCLWSNPFDTFR